MLLLMRVCDEQLLAFPCNDLKNINAGQQY